MKKTTAISIFTIFFAIALFGCKEKAKSDISEAQSIVESEDEDVSESEEEDEEIPPPSEKNPDWTYSTDENGNESAYDKKGNRVYFRNVKGLEIWDEYDEQNKLVYKKFSNGIERKFDSEGRVIYESRLDWSGVKRESFNDYDEKGNLVHEKWGNGKECWSEYDENNNRLHEKRSDGTEYWYEYDENGNKIHYRKNNGEEQWYENGKVIHEKTSDGDEKWYDGNGKKIHAKFGGVEKEEWWEYNDDGKMIFYKNSYGAEEKFNDNGELIYKKNSTGYEEWWEYNDKDFTTHYKNSNGDEVVYSNGHIIYQKSSDGVEWWYEYDKNGRQIYYKNNKGNEYWTEYDSNGNMIHEKYASGFEKWYEYNDKNIKIYYKDTDGTEERFNDNGELIYSKDSRGEEWYKYDDKNRVIYYKTNDTIASVCEESYFYHETGKLTFRKYRNGLEKWIKEDYNGHHCERMLVCTDDGSPLNYRDYPNGDSLGKFPNGTMVFVLESTEMKSKVNGIEDYWYYVCTRDDVTGWVFGAYLESNEE